MFANRLIKGTSGSDDAEESILQKLNGKQISSLNFITFFKIFAASNTQQS